MKPALWGGVGALACGGGPNAGVTEPGNGLAGETWALVRPLSRAALGACGYWPNLPTAREPITITITITIVITITIILVA